MLDSNVIKFPYGVSRRAHSRKPRRSSTPEERAAKAATRAAASEERRRRPKRVLTGEDWDEFVRIVGPDLQQEFMVEAWKLINRFGRKL